MMTQGDKWQITIENWAYSGVGQEYAGARQTEFYVIAEDIDQALSFAHAIAEGIRTNPSVWQSPIKSIVLVQP
jgi:hypothetical protein